MKRVAEEVRMALKAEVVFAACSGSDGSLTLGEDGEPRDELGDARAVQRLLQSEHSEWLQVGSRYVMRSALRAGAEPVGVLVAAFSSPQAASEPKLLLDTILTLVGHLVQRASTERRATLPPPDIKVGARQLVSVKSAGRPRTARPRSPPRRPPTPTRSTGSPVWIQRAHRVVRRAGPPARLPLHPPLPDGLRASAPHGQVAAISRGTRRDVRRPRVLRELIAASPFPDAELHITEWSTSPSSRDPMHDTLFAATYITRAFLRCAGPRRLDLVLDLHRRLRGGRRRHRPVPRRLRAGQRAGHPQADVPRDGDARPARRPPRSPCHRHGVITPHQRDGALAAVSSTTPTTWTTAGRLRPLRGDAWLKDMGPERTSGTPSTGSSRARLHPRGARLGHGNVAEAWSPSVSPSTSRVPRPPICASR